MKVSELIEQLGRVADKSREVIVSDKTATHVSDYQGRPVEIVVS